MSEDCKEREPKEIKAPFVGLTQWRKNNVPEAVWNNPYLAAYRSKENAVNAILVTIMMIMALIAGFAYAMYYFGIR